MSQPIGFSGRLEATSAPTVANAHTKTKVASVTSHPVEVLATL
jgi:hypothetical protein